MKKLNADTVPREARLREIAAISDDQIDCSDIPECRDFSGYKKTLRRVTEDQAAIRKVMDKKTIYELLYSADDPVAAKWLKFALIIGKVTYKPGWYLRTGVEEGRMWVQVGVTDEAEISWDMIAKKKVPWRGAKHYLSPHMCRNEIVSTVYHAIERAELHEVKEWFRYRGASIFNPHLDPDALVEVAKWAKNFNVRVGAMTMEEPT